MYLIYLLSKFKLKNLKLKQNTMNNYNIVQSFICNQFYRNTRYFCQIFLLLLLSESENFPPFFRIPSSKKRILFWQIRIPLAFSIQGKRIFFFEDGILKKGENSHFLTTTKIFGRNTVYYG